MVLDYDQLFDNKTRTAEYNTENLDEILIWCMANKIKVQVSYERLWFTSSRDYILYTLRWL